MSELETGKTYLIKYREQGVKQKDYIGRFIRKNYSNGNFRFRFQILYSRVPRDFRDPRSTENAPYNKWEKFNTGGDNVIEFSPETEVFDLGEYGGLITYKDSPDDVVKKLSPPDAVEEATPYTSFGGKKYLGIKRKGKRKTNRKTKRNYKNTKKNRKQYKR